MVQFRLQLTQPVKVSIMTIAKVLAHAYRLFWTAIVFLVPLFAAMLADMRVLNLGPMSEITQSGYFGNFWFMYMFMAYMPLALLCPKFPE